MGPKLAQLVAGIPSPFGDASDRLYWPFLVGGLILPLAVLGLRRGAAALAHGLFARRIWAHPSARRDLSLLLFNALLFGVWRIPWLAGMVSATLGIAIWMHNTVGPAPDLPLPVWAICTAYTLSLFVVWDFSRWVLHWALHRNRRLWAIHQVHHSAQVLTPLTLHRVHPVETLLYDLRGLVATALVTAPFLYLFRGQAIELELMGINALAFAFNLAGANLRHSHVWLRFGRLERWLLSPAQHQMHHARQRTLSESNYGTWLAVWDRVAGTWLPAPRRPPADPMTSVGLDDADHDPDGFASLLIDPLRRALGR